MKRIGFVTLVAIVCVGCASNPDKRTLADLRDVPPDVREIVVEDMTARDVLQRILEHCGEEKKTQVLIYYEDVWSTGGPDFARLKQGIWDSGCVWARIY